MSVTAAVVTKVLPAVPAVIAIGKEVVKEAAPVIQKIESKIIERKKKQISFIESEVNKALGRTYGEEAFSVDPISMVTYKITFPREMPQSPLVFIQPCCQESTDQVFCVITEKSSASFLFTVHNLNNSKAEGTVQWYAFVQP